MRVVFRADASLEIGSGHIFRCLTLADVLKDAGSSCAFLTRALPGHLIGEIKTRGYPVYTLSKYPTKPVSASTEKNSDYDAWLGVPFDQELQECKEVLRQLKPDWVVVDHYALDERWEAALGLFYRHLMAIDDLANRKHLCDLLLDQNLGKMQTDYRSLVKPHCRLLLGPEYALLRPQFALMREESLRRRDSAPLESILITMGGVDRKNVTERVLSALGQTRLPSSTKVRVIVGPSCPWLDSIRIHAGKMPFDVSVLSNVKDMDRYMSQADLAIGGAGSTSWERCCLGVPTLMVSLAPNQDAIAKALEGQGAALFVGSQDNVRLESDIAEAVNELDQNTHRLSTMSAAASEITDGLGARRVTERILELT